MDYIDQSNGGWMTRDYNMDQSDLARMNVTGYRNNRDGTRTPIVNGMGEGSALKQPYDNYAANGWTRGQDGSYAAPTASPFVGQAAPRGNAGYQMPGVVGNAGGHVTSQPPAIPGGVSVQPIPGAQVATLPQQYPATELDRSQMLLNQQEQNRLTSWNNGGALPSMPKLSSDPKDADANAQAMREYTATMARQQRSRVAWLPGGTNLLNSLNGGDGSAIMSNIDGSSSNPFLTEAEGKKQIGDSRLNMDLINDPRFKQLMANNPENGSRFYQAVTGRDLEGDTKAQVAQMTAQRGVQADLNKNLAEHLVVATDDDPNHTYKRGDIVYRSSMPDPLRPGMMTTGYNALSPVQSQQAGINLKGEMTGDSDIHRTTGYFGPADIQAMRIEQARLRAQKQAHEDSGAAAVRSDNYDTRMEALRASQSNPSHPVSPKFVPFDSPMYNQQSNFGRDINSAFVDNRATDNWGRMLNNMGVRVSNYVDGTTNSTYKNNDEMLRHMADQQFRLRQQYGDDALDYSGPPAL